ncbi:MAG: LEA type 2 family protein [Gammaproteobacteria bacterium]|nr:LEA type 2 family protein [Gammaproteobacteria bacterium]
MLRQLKSWSCLLLVLSLTACAWLPQKPQAPRVSLVSVQLISMELLEQRYGLTLRIQNPNDFALNIQGLDFEVELNRMPFASGVAGHHVAVPAFGEALMQVEVSSSVWSLARQLREMGEARQEEFHYRIHGRMSLGRRLTAIPFESAGTIPLIPTTPTR